MKSLRTLPLILLVAMSLFIQCDIAFASTPTSEKTATSAGLVARQMVEGNTNPFASKSGSAAGSPVSPTLSPGESVMEGSIAGGEKTVANGLYMSGVFSYLFSGANVTVTLDRINNDSFTRTSGTLRLELWASVAKPARGAGFTGYRLGVSSLLDPLPPRTFYSNLSETKAYLRPPDGTYWLLLVLTEFAPGCGQPDNYCQQDSFVSFSQEVFGNPPPPAPILGVLTNTLGSRGTVSPTSTLYGGFSLASASKVYILVRGNSLGTLGITQNFLDAPHVRLFNAQGANLVTQGSFSGFNFCLASNTATDYPVIALYQNRGEPPHSRDSCYSATLSAGVYTFAVTPSVAGDAATTSVNPTGEILFEVSLGRP